MRRVPGKRVGVLGLGRIGRAIAIRLEAFGCALPPAYPAARLPDCRYGYGYAARVRELAEGADILVVATSGGEGTRGLVDQAALVELLLTGQLARAGLDVFAEEPKVPDELFALDNLTRFLADGTLLTPVPEVLR